VPDNNRPQPPYGVIADALRAGRVIPFLGAGASMTGRQPGEAFDPRLPSILPSGGELSRALAAYCNFPASDVRDCEDLAKVASYYAGVSGRGYLKERIRALLAARPKPGSIHRFLASVPTNRLLVVTNYDTLLEQAFSEAQRPYDLLVYPADYPEYANGLLLWRHGSREPEKCRPHDFDFDVERDRALIFKMHGTIASDKGWDNFVITEEDYVDFLARMAARSAIPKAFYGYMRDRSFLFLGYGLHDWNLRVVLRNLSTSLGQRGAVKAADAPRSWAIQVEPSELERQLWSRRGIEIYNQDLEHFVVGLTGVA
jgi:hypothetical protein